MLNTKTHSINSLTITEIAQMYALFEQYYDGVNFASFNNDLSAKDYVLILRSDQNNIIGFSTLEIIDFQTQNKPARALFSGDTIIHHHHWGSQELSKAWCHLAGQIKAELPDQPLYWFLIVKGHRTYRYLPVFTHQFYPNHKSQTPANIQQIIDHLSTTKFSDAYLKDQGIVHYPTSHGHLRENWADIPSKHMNNRHVKFFLQRNPGYQQGDELVCLTELSDTNMRSVAKHMFVQGLHSAEQNLAVVEQ